MSTVCAANKPSPVVLTIRPFMGRDARINQLGADGSEPPTCALLVGADQPRVTGYISGENGGKAAGSLALLPDS